MFNSLKIWKPSFEKVPTIDTAEDSYNDNDSDPQSSDVEGLLSSEKQALRFAPTVQKSSRIRCLTIINVVFFCASMIILASVAAMNSAQWQNGNYDLKKVTAYSPIFDKIHIPMVTKQMEATLLVDPESSSIFRQEPSHEVDAAWDRLANVRPIPITHEDVVRLGKDPEQAAKFPESFGFGQDAYIGRMDVFHIVHCLDQVRREAHFDHYYGKLWGTRANASELHRTHISHCFHLLLQNIMCSPNLDIYTHFWADAQLNAFPDFNVNHQCVDFETVLQWQEQNSVPVDDFAAIRRPDDYKVHVMTPKFKELFGYEGPKQFEGEEIG